MINVSRGAYLNLTNGLLVTDGNSISFESREADGSQSPLTYPVQLLQHPLISPLNITLRNPSVGGQDINAMINRASTFVDPYYVPGRSVLVAWEFTNQLFNNSSVQSAFNKFAQYCQARRNIGWKIVVVTALARNRKPSWGSITEFNQALSAVNQLLRDNWQQFADQIVDVRLIPELDPVQVTYIPDGTHPNALGHSFFVKALAPTLLRIPRN